MSSRRRRRRGTSAPSWTDDQTYLSASDDQYFAGTAADHKLIQLCRQVEEAICYALAASADPVLRDLFVVSVEPSRGASLLRVSLQPDEDMNTDYRTIQDKLDRARGYLRGEIARSIHRKRVPSLELVLLPPRAQREEVNHD